MARFLSNRNWYFAQNSRLISLQQTEMAAPYFRCLTQINCFMSSVRCSSDSATTVCFS